MRLSRLLNHLGSFPTNLHVDLKSPLLLTDEDGTKRAEVSEDGPLILSPVVGPQTEAKAEGGSKPEAEGEAKFSKKKEDRK